MKCERRLFESKCPFLRSPRKTGIGARSTLHAGRTPRLTPQEILRPIHPSLGDGALFYLPESRREEAAGINECSVTHATERFQCVFNRRNSSIYPQPGFTLWKSFRLSMIHSPYFLPRKKEEVLRLLPIGFRQRPTLPGRLQPSTIGTEGLNFCVRYGNRWDPFVITTGNCELVMQVRFSVRFPARFRLPSVFLQFSPACCIVPRFLLSVKLCFPVPLSSFAFAPVSASRSGSA